MEWNGCLFLPEESSHSSSVHSGAETISVVSKQPLHLHCRIELPYAPITQPLAMLIEQAPQLLQLRERETQTSSKVILAPGPKISRGVPWFCWNTMMQCVSSTEGCPYLHISGMPSRLSSLRLTLSTCWCWNGPSCCGCLICIYICICNLRRWN